MADYITYLSHHLSLSLSLSVSGNKSWSCWCWTGFTGCLLFHFPRAVFLFFRCIGDLWDSGTGEVRVRYGSAMVFTMLCDILFSFSVFLFFYFSFRGLDSGTADFFFVSLPYSEDQLLTNGFLTLYLERYIRVCHVRGVV